LRVKEWIIELLEAALNIWSEKIAEIFELLTTSPEVFMPAESGTGFGGFGGGEGTIWTVIKSIHEAMQGIGFALLVLFFMVGAMKTLGSFAELKRPEVAVKLFLRFIIAKTAVTHGLELLMKLMNIAQGVVSTIFDASELGESGAFSGTALPDAIRDAVNATGFLNQMGLLAVTLILCLVVWVLSFVVILTVYGRFFKIYMYVAVAPIPLAAFAGESTQSIGVAYMKSFAGVLLEGAIILLACVIYSYFAGAPAFDETKGAATMVWSYLGKLVFGMLVLVGTVKTANTVVREMMGL
jgi:hypothetical protein